MEDVAVLQVVLELPGRHDRTVLLRLRGRGAQMGDSNDVLSADDFLRGEVHDILGEPSLLQGLQHGGGIHQLAPCEVEQHGGGLAVLEQIPGDIVPGIGRKGDMDGDEVTLLHQGFQADRRCTARERPQACSMEMKGSKPMTFMPMA